MAGQVRGPINRQLQYEIFKSIVLLVDVLLDPLTQLPASASHLTLFNY